MIDFDANDVLETGAKRLQVSHGVQVALSRTGENLRVARLRRKETIASTAKRVGVSASTYKRLEAGDGGVSAAAYFEALSLFGFLEQLTELGDPAKDEQGLILARLNLSKKGRQ